ncbi:MAG TPA: hypothetical protein VN950_02255 [Terriglobales bacterium]|nr:hypothetical protein [Terriglobales bacterium]
MMRSIFFGAGLLFVSLGRLVAAEPAVGTSSQLQIVYPPSDIVRNGSEENVQTTFALRALKDHIGDPKIVAGSLRDEDSSAQLPTEAFQLVRTNGGTEELSATALTKFSIRLDKKFLRAGKYSGTLWVGASQDSGAQSIPLKVFVRPHYSWLIGGIAIAVGALLSWFTLFWVARQRQLAANQVLIVRLQKVVSNLIQILQSIPEAVAPAPAQSMAHLKQIQRVGIPQLLNDKELSVIAGVVVPPTGSVSVVDEIDGMNRIVQHGFTELLRMWNAQGANQAALIPLFQEMDTLGATAQPLANLDTKIQTILAKGPTARMVVDGHSLPSEDTIVHRVIATTQLLDVLSVLTVTVVGLYVLIWKNAGFGTMGNYIEAFLWGLGLKLGSDLTKLGPSDVRTSIGIKTPSATS